MVGFDFDVVGVGNALVDILSYVDEEFLAEMEVQKAIMQLIGPERATHLTAALPKSNRTCGGSTANTIASLAQIGVQVGYVGKVADDELGQLFCEDLASLGVTYSVPLLPSQNEVGTGRCLVFITPDAERSMSTYLGAAEFLAWEDFDTEMIASARWLYLEGYRFDGVAGQEAFHQAVRRCRYAGGKVALTLSDPICVSRHRNAFVGLMKENGIDLLFCNKAELLSLYETKSIESALDRASQVVEIVACTLGEQGVIVGRGDERVEICAAPVTSVLDVTGAGDLFAAGFLFGMIRGKDLQTSARMGSVAAAEVIGHIGARPVADLTKLFHGQNLL